MIVKPCFFKAKNKKGQIFKAQVETFINSVHGFGYIESDIPEQPSNMRELISLRQKGYIIEENNHGILL